jgi:HAD superfamily hydrolase (TIGR01509 family)
MMKFSFDLDGTLVQWRCGYTWRDWVTNVADPILKRHGLDGFGLKEWQRLFSGELARDHFDRYGVNSERLWKELDRADLAYRKSLLRRGCAQPYADVAVLNQLEGPLSVVSNAGTRSVRYTAEHLGIDKYFKLVQGKIYERVNWCKPNPELILYVLKRLGLEPRQVGYVGDKLVDVLAARRAGCIAIHINRAGKKNLAARAAHFSLSSLDGLLEL